MGRRGTATRLLPALLAAAILAFGGFGCKVESREIREKTQPVTLRWWSVFSDYSALAPVIRDFRVRHPNVKVEYRKFGFDEYEQAVLDAMAEGRGPDVLSLHHTWLREWQERLVPSPATLEMAFVEIQGSIKKEQVTVLREVSGATPGQVNNDFLDVVSGDVILPVPQSDPRLPPVSRVFGLPLSVDTMVMYYNRGILDAAEIPKPAQDWGEFQQQVRSLTKLDESGGLVQSAVSLGTADNVERAADILSLLMIQNGTPMSDQTGGVTFDRHSEATVGQPMTPGATALVFYNDFANPLKEVYTWNEEQPDSLQAFMSGKTAYFFGYSYHLPQIRAQAPDLNLGIAAMPQIAGNQPVNYANYWVETVSGKTAHLDEAWSLVRFVTQADNAKKYLSSAGRPTALRQLVNGQLEESDMSAFASQLPSARSWYRGKDGQATERVFLDMISAMLQPEADPQRILEVGAVKVNQTL